MLTQTNLTDHNTIEVLTSEVLQLLPTEKSGGSQ